MSLTEAIQSVFQKYAVFTGRARRSEYWYWTLFNICVSMLIYAVASYAKMPILSSIWAIAVFIPSLAVAIRRLHDIGKSGYYYLFVLIPIVGPIILIIWFTKDSEEDTNEYGTNPKITW